MKAALPRAVRDLLEPQLPAWIVPAWFGTLEEGRAAVADAGIGWLDLGSKAEMSQLIRDARSMRWLNTQYVGLDQLPVEVLRARNVVVTNGAGLNAVTIAEFVVMGMLTVAKGYREIVQAQQRREWLTAAPGRVELAGTRALVIGYGAIGQLVAARLKAFDVEVTAVRRSATGEDGVLGADEWRDRVGDFDWIVLCVPATPDTVGLFGASELRSMKSTGVLLNVARGTVVDQGALVQALKERRIAAAFLDVTDPEPLPESHELWRLDNAHITMHLSGRSQTRMGERVVRRFVQNLERHERGLPLAHVVDLDLGY